MEVVSIHEVIEENWREALQLTVRPEQQRFTAHYAPIAALALAKAYIRPGGTHWMPFAIYAGETMVGFFALAREAEKEDERWLFHFFIDQRYQGRGYGRAALQRLIELVRRESPQCQWLRLVVHPENLPAQRLYASVGFRPTDGERWGEPVYELAVSRPSPPNPLP